MNRAEPAGNLSEPPRTSLWREIGPDQWSVPYVALLVYTFGMVTGRLPVGTAAILIGLTSLLFAERSFRSSRPLVWMVVFLLWAGVGYLVSDYKQIVAEVLTERFKLVLVVLLVISAIRTRRQAQFFLAFAMICFLLYPIRGALTNYFIWNYTAFGRAVAGGIYNNSNDLGALTLLQMSVALAFFSSARRRIGKLFALGVAGSMALTILLTQSRGVFLGGLTFLALIVWSSDKKFQAVAAIVVVMIVTLAVLPQETFERFTAFTEALGSERSIRDADPEGSAEGRSDIYKIAYQVGKDHLVFGIGVGSYPIANEIYANSMEGISDTAKRRIDAHSSYLTLWAENGLIGLLLYLVFLNSGLRRARRARDSLVETQPRTAQQLRFLVAGYLGFLVAAVVGTYISLSMTYVHLFAIWVLAANALDEEEAKSAPDEPQNSV